MHFSFCFFMPWSLNRSRFAKYLSLCSTEWFVMTLGWVSSRSTVSLYQFKHGNQALLNALHESCHLVSIITLAEWSTESHFMAESSLDMKCSAILRDFSKASLTSHAWQKEPREPSQKCVWLHTKSQSISSCRFLFSELNKSKMHVIVNSVNQ